MNGQRQNDFLQRVRIGHTLLPKVKEAELSQDFRQEEKVPCVEVDHVFLQNMTYYATSLVVMLVQSDVSQIHGASRGKPEI